jgi:hypothetical protein
MYQATTRVYMVQTLRWTIAAFSGVTYFISAAAMAVCFAISNMYGMPGIDALYAVLLLVLYLSFGGIFYWAVFEMINEFRNRGTQQ